MLSDTSTGKRWFESIVQLAIFYSLATYFAESELTEAGYISADAPFWQFSERMVLGFFLFEFAYRWVLAKNRWRYPFTFLAIIDLLAILPSFAGMTMRFHSLKLIRTLRILRLFKLYRYNEALQNVMHGFRKVKDELAVVGFVVIIMVMFSSVAMYELEHDVQPEKFRRLSDCVWWSFVTLTTVGYGDLYPVTAGGRLIAILTMVVGIGIFGTFISLIGSSFISSMRDESRHHAPPGPHVGHGAHKRDLHRSPAERAHDSRA